MNIKKQLQTALILTEIEMNQVTPLMFSCQYSWLFCLSGSFHFQTQSQWTLQNEGTPRQAVVRSLTS